jgi:hypothetical protein
MHRHAAQIPLILGLKRATHSPMHNGRVIPNNKISRLLPFNLHDVLRLRGVSVKIVNDAFDFLGSTSSI